VVKGNHVVNGLSRPLSLLSLAIAAVLAASAPARADEPKDRGRSVDRGETRDNGRTSRQRRQDTLSDSIRLIERTTRGEVLSAERMQSDGRDINRIKVVDDNGRVRVYLDDPQRRRAPTRDDDD
jgi:hypothetical protein